MAIFVDLCFKPLELFGEALLYGPSAQSHRDLVGEARACDRGEVHDDETNVGAEDWTGEDSKYTSAWDAEWHKAEDRQHWNERERLIYLLDICGNEGHHDEPVWVLRVVWNHLMYAS